MQKIIDKYTEKQRKFRSQPLISIETPLDTRFQRIRTQGMNFEKNQFLINRNRRKRPKVDATIFDSALSHTRRSDASQKEKKIACPLLDIFACGQVSSPRMYRLRLIQISVFLRFTGETNFGSFTADIMRDITGCEIALINSGTFRSDKKFDQSNPLTVGDMNSIFPILDRIVKLKVKSFSFF